MSSVNVAEVDLREVDICDGGVESDEESGVLENSLWVCLEKRPGFHTQRSHDDLQPHSHCSNKFTSVSPTPCLLSAGTLSTVRVEPLYHQAWTRCDEEDSRSVCRSSIVDCLLVELYDTYSSGKSLRSADSLDSSTEASGSDAFLGRSNTASSFLQELQEKHTKRHQRNYLAQKGLFLRVCLSPMKMMSCRKARIVHSSRVCFLNKVFLHLL